MKLGRIVDALEKKFPPSLAENWDNCGLIIGKRSAEIKTVVATVDLTKKVVAEAKKRRAQLIMSHHPVFIKGAKAITDAEREGSLALSLIEGGIAFYAAHTNLDSAEGGINDELAAILGIEDVNPIDPAAPEGLFKIVVFVPRTHTAIVLSTMSEAGAGGIGNYDSCSFRAPGTGTFRALEGANPFLGEVGKLEDAAEDRLEMLVAKPLMEQVIKAMLATHPYEKAAFDVYATEPGLVKAGLGRWGKLKRPSTVRAIAAKLKKELGAPLAEFTGSPNRRVKTVGVLGGGGGDFEYVEKALSLGIELYITGEAGHHPGLLAEDCGMSLMRVGHFYSERVAPRIFARFLKGSLPGLKVIESKLDTDPFNRI